MKSNTRTPNRERTDAGGIFSGNPKTLWTILGLLLFIPLAWIVGDRTIFLLGSKRADGQIFSIDSRNTKCSFGGGSRGNRKRPCTRYYARIGFQDHRGVDRSFVVASGRARGHDQGEENSRFQIGEDVPVIYSAKNPNRAYKRSFAGIWGTAVQVALLQAVFFFVGRMSSRRDSADGGGDWAWGGDSDGGGDGD